MNKLIDEIRVTLKPLEILVPADRQIACIVEPGEVHRALAYLKSSGFAQLSILTCVDWIEDGEFELVYILMNWNEGIHVQLRARIDRNEPVFNTITHIYPGARYYEREVHEFFGIEFKGNEDSYKPLFLERWDAIPPLRKDFDPQAYSDSKFPMRDRDRVFKSRIGGTEDERS
ncbi:MAG TPA: NADH-quinone oxidoreductase subunit C [Clostridia bacterium]|nr:NADH-quinone oxidoreductase subunit C [Clostridia bacterium]HRX42327.1 NADH-quinone oxidoreductase subunit C [Clostridia bacterium]